MSSTKTFSTLLLSFVCVLAASNRAYAGPESNPTTTTLNVSSNSVAAGTAVTLTATVTGTNWAVTGGQVVFCDATAAHCDGTAVFGTAQVTSNHTAKIKLILGVGNYSIQAEYGGIPAGGPVGASTSTAQAVTVTAAANYVSSTTIGVSGSVGDYALTSTVTAFGKPDPTGTVSFLDTTNGNAAVASAPLEPATLATVFNPASGSPITSQPSVEFVVSGDFNNDGIPDLAIPNEQYSGTVAIFLGNGDGTFQSPVSYNDGQYPQSMAAADVNGDGNLDLISTNLASSNISVMLGNGDGTFQAQTAYGTGDSPSFIAVGDFNRDGWLDLAVVNNGDNTISILLGNGDGTFQTQVTYAVGSYPEGVSIGDFNQDGFLDLAVSNSSDGTVSILLGNGNGTFQTQQTIALPANTYPYWLASGDLRKNGTLDLVVPDSSSPNVYVLLGNGDGTFQPAVDYVVGDAPWGVSLGDLNGDGVLDLVVPDTGADGLVSVLLGNGDGTFATKTDYSVGNNPSWVVLADFNGDGLLDLATSDIGPSTSTILLQARTETATATGVAVFGVETHNVLANYPGDASRAASQSSTVPLTGVAQTATATILTASPNPATAGQAITFTATISPAPTGSTLGSINFYSGSTLLSTAAVNSSGVATFTTSSLSTGSYTITAVYSGNAGFIGSTSPGVSVSVTGIVQTATATTLTASVNPVDAGASVTFTATVSPAPTGTPLGSVSFYNGSTLLGTVTVNSSGVATFTTNSLSAGSYTITAVYAGNTAFLGSTSTGLSFTVTGTAAFTVSSPPTPVSVSPGGAATFNITVPPVGGSYNSVVTMSASGLPAGATASFNPATLTPGAAGAPTVLTIHTAAQTAGIPANPKQGFPYMPISLAAGLFLMGGKRKRLAKSLPMLLALVMLAATTFSLTGCSGGFAGNTAQAQNHSYVITVTGTSGSQHASTTVTLIVM
jgi:hypothetical protein